MNIYTIGFTQKKAQIFFNLLKKNQVKKIIDVRLNNVSQLAGFAKRDDLIYFLKEICNCEYEHVPDLAPIDEILKPYKKGEISWQNYEEKFMSLMSKRNIEKSFNLDDFNDQCLLCSEHLPHQCHRRLVLDYLAQSQTTISEIKHLY
ncbi:DUF488 domain-containing protein [Acinetobacter variabilis]|uniref:DUF488 domain-containing protein n=1 Tax=Acinetobacter TaxID=469 RepID=UPI000CDC82B2|nr:MULTISPECIES: DUF488 domain-containing protein [Acinetobacter]AUX90753.1 hypothetical protein C3F22_13640 [Acinetobacter sp. ACNIH1]MBO3659700.1 DUF488 domain-containing protein [Acinetobacter variabilis]MCU4312414.1 DUF488 domain-containing protein [Acinetobacter variabilis]WPC35013.1 DUF488 domain-containing protein [Acinetobacter sp. YWS30-1]